MDEINAEYLTIKTSVVVPSLQSLVNGCFYGGAVGGVVAVANSLELLTVPAWAVGVTIGSLASLRAWHNLLDDWRALLYGVEYAEPESEPVTVIQPQPVRVELSGNDGRSMQFIDLPADPAQLAALAGQRKGLR